MEKATSPGGDENRLADDDIALPSHCCFATARADAGAVVTEDNVQLAVPRQAAASKSALPLYAAPSGTESIKPS